MTEQELIGIAQNLTMHIIVEMKDEYDRTESGNLFNDEATDATQIDEYVNEIIKEWDFAMGDVLADMKTEPFGPNGTDTVRTMIYKILKGYCDMERETALKKSEDGKIGFTYFQHTLDTAKEKGGMFYQKLWNEIKDFV
tara:strand:+ start:207 stop:623 length:417 start_codon:yes stop_codon:yes gene_type:complete